MVLVTDESTDAVSCQELKIQKALGLRCRTCPDYIIGPTSTYSGWRSFYSNKPLWHALTVDAR
jgi:hypothetical protein